MPRTLGKIARFWSGNRAAAGIARPSRTGFGTKLIDVNIKRELGGTINREFGDGGLTIEIEVPLQD